MTTTLKFGIKPKLAIVLAPSAYDEWEGAMTTRMFLQKAPAIKAPRS